LGQGLRTAGYATVLDIGQTDFLHERYKLNQYDKQVLDDNYVANEKKWLKNYQLNQRK
jgi:hypothetical protein